jgi:dienelactone hydrolase
MLVLGSLISLMAADDPKTDDRVKAARAMLAALVKGNYDGAGKDFDDTMKEVAPPAKLKQTWEAALKQLGKLKKQGEPRQTKQGEYQIVFLPCEFEKKALDVKVVFDKEGKITGYFFVPSKATYKYDPPSYAKPDSYTEQEVTIGAGEWALPGTLTMPRGDGPFPAVVLLAGSGPNDRDGTLEANKPLRDLAWGLASRGIAVLRFDKRTLAHRAKMIKLSDRVTIKEEVLDDAVSAAAFVRKQKGVDPKKVYVVGHSLGALMAPRVGDLDPSLAGLVMLAGCSRPLEDVLLEQIEYVASLKSDRTEKDKEELEKLKKQIARLKDPKLSPDTPASELPLGATAVYWLSLRAYDAAAAANKIKQPLLILQGERDYQVTMADFAGWKKKLADRKGVTFKSYPKLNHLFLPGEGKSAPSEYARPNHVAEEVVKDIAAWIKR